MSCPTCDHTMDHVGREDQYCKCFHCMRCGTMVLRYSNTERDMVYQPKLVERCRDWAGKNLGEGTTLLATWKRLGIAESINLPKDRQPQP